MYYALYKKADPRHREGGVWRCIKAARRRYLACLFFVLVWMNAGMFSTLWGQQSTPRNLLQHAVADQNIQACLSRINKWRRGWRESLTKQLTALPATIKKQLADTADRQLEFDWPALPASLFLEYKQNGNRSDFETVLAKRRSVLSSLVVGYMVTREKRYLPQIVNGLYAIMEESTWVLPAHLTLQQSGIGLPDPGDKIIDLGCAMTAPLIASVQFLMRDQLDSISPNINKRIDLELATRILRPYLERTDYWWMGFHAQRVNNWNPWINADVLYTALLNENNPAILDQLLNKIIRSTDIFINQYPADGGCDEGTTYWSHAGGMLVYLLKLLNSVSEGKIGFKNDTLLRHMASYIYKMQIAGDYFVNSGDAAPRTVPSPAKVYLYGTLFDDDTLKGFGAYLASLQKSVLPADNLQDFIMTLGVFDRLKKHPKITPQPAVSWLRDLQVVTARSGGGSQRGMFFSAKGGNNGESHNHNDVGNFVIYANGQPVIVDAGLGVYSSKTFSKERYTLWQVQSDWHNVPAINGYSQQAGKEFKAEKVLFDQKDKKVMFSMDISKAYPEKAGINSWSRVFVFNPDNRSLELTDQFSLCGAVKPGRLFLLTPCTLEEKLPGIWIFFQDKAKTKPLMEMCTRDYNVKVEQKVLDDSRLRNSWGEKLFRLVLIVKDVGLKGKEKVTFRMPTILK